MPKQKINPNSGDKITIILEKKTESGILLESHEKGILLLKLKTGYNIGINKDNILKIKIIEKATPIKEIPDLKLSHEKPVIDFYLTGGTISSKLDPKTGAVKDLLDANELFSMYPEIFEVADVHIKSPFMKASENMNSNDWIKLAKLVGKSLNNPSVAGVIISHGTDFLHYTAAALSFMLPDLKKPVVLTYSQRSSDRGSSDARLNLKCAVFTALSDIAEVVLVGHNTINDNSCAILRGTKCRKMHTSRRDAFKPINTKPIATINEEGTITKLSNYNKRRKGKTTIDPMFNDTVALIKFYPNQNPEILDYYQKNYKGIIIEVSGLGHLITEGKNNWIPKLKEVINKGLLVFAAPQTLYGRLDPFVYSPGRKLQEAGVIFLKDILPETALIKLGYVLGHKEWRGSIMTNEKMLQNLKGEFNNRLGTEFI